MSTIQLKDRASLCTFTFADGRRCRTPRQSGHTQFCCFHARKQAQAAAVDQLGRDFAYLFSGDYISACDLAAALGRLFAAVARGDVKPRAAATLAYLAHTTLQTIEVAQDEYINAFGTPAWRDTVYTHVKENLHYLTHGSAPTPPQPPPPAETAPQAAQAAAGKPQPAPSAGDKPQSALAAQPSVPVEAGLQSGSSSASTKAPRPPRKPRRNSSADAPQPASDAVQPSLPVEAGLQPSSSSASTNAPQPATPSPSRRKPRSRCHYAARCLSPSLPSQQPFPPTPHP